MEFIFGNPALVDLVQRHRIQVMQFLPTLPDYGDEFCRFQQSQVLGDALPGHGEALTQLGQGLAVALVQLIEQLSPAFVSQCFEHCIHEPNKQLYGCICKKILSAMPFEVHFRSACLYTGIQEFPLLAGGEGFNSRRRRIGLGMGRKSKPWIIPGSKFTKGPTNDGSALRALIR